MITEQIVQFDNAIGDGLIKPLQLLLDIGDLGLKGQEPVVDGRGASGTAFGKRGQKFGEALAIKQLFLEGSDDTVVEELHRDGIALAGRRSLLGAARAGVIGIDLSRSRRAGALGHPAAAMGAGCQTREEDGAVDDTRRRHLRIVSRKLGLHPVKQALIDNCRDRNLDDFALRLLFAGLGRADIVFPAADIGGVGKDQMERADTEGAAALRAMAPFVQPDADTLDAKRWRIGCRIAIRIETVNQLHGLLLDRIDLQLLLDFLATPFGFDDPVTERWGRAVPEILFGVFQHRASDVLAIFLGCVFIEDADDLPHHLLTGVLARRLRGGDNLDTMLAQLADRQFHRRAIAKEAREGMHHDDIVGTICIACAIEHGLKRRPAVVCARRARLDIFVDDIPTLAFAVAGRQITLGRQRDIAIGLTTCGHPQIEGRA